MNIRFYHARILTMEEDKPIFEGEVWVRDEKIFYVGDGHDMDAFSSVRKNHALYGMRKLTVPATC